MTTTLDAPPVDSNESWFYLTSMSLAHRIEKLPESERKHSLQKRYNNIFTSDVNLSEIFNLIKDVS